MTIELPVETSVAMPDQRSDETPVGELTSLTDHAVDLVARLPGSVSRVRVRSGAAEIEVEWAQAPAVIATGSAAPLLALAPALEPAAVAGTTEVVASGAVAITAPLVGVFYAAPEPGEPPFVKVGDQITKGQQVGIVEAMKLMNTILADTDGVVTAIHVDSGDSVEFDQILLEVDPS